MDSWNNTYGCVRHIAHDLDKIYCEFNDKEVSSSFWDFENSFNYSNTHHFQQFVEAYDLFADPFQMTNLGFDMLPSERAIYSLHLAKLKKCKSESCQMP